MEKGAASTGGNFRDFRDYQLGLQIGRGAMGAVYEGYQRSLHRRVALKMILDSEASSPAARHRLAIEAEASAKLDHPHIVPIYEVGEHEGRPFLAMKLIPGTNLQKKIASGELCLAAMDANTSRNALRQRLVSIAQLVATIAHAVQHAHINTVLHRDLKPANILVDLQGQPHLTDFGLAKILQPDPDGTAGARTASGTILGTLSYMSPEQAAGHRLTPASDVYSLGAILYEMLTGNPPIRGKTYLEMLRLLEEQEPTAPSVRNPRVNKDFDTICLKCLEKRPDTRYPTAEALAEDLEKWLKGEPINARPIGAIPRTARWMKRNPVGTGLIISLCACLAVSLVLLDAQIRKNRQTAALREVMLNQITRNIKAVWATDEEFVTIRSHELAALDNRPIRNPFSNSLNLTFGLNIRDDPESQATRYAPFLHELEKQMSRALNGRPVDIDLQLHKTKAWEALYGARKEADVQNMTFLVYARLKSAGMAFLPLAKERVGADAVVFTRSDTGITKENWTKLAGRSVAFAHTNSIISSHFKILLANQGVCVNQLRAYTNLNPTYIPQLTATERYAAPSLAPAGGEHFAHRDVIRKVEAGEFEVGVAPDLRFRTKLSSGAKLLELHHFQVAPQMYVARAGLPKTTVNALRRSMIAIRNADLLSQTKRKMQDGLERVTDAEIQHFEKLLNNDLHFFENCQYPTSLSNSLTNIPSKR